MMSFPVAGVVLVGGRSSRMGQDKALLKTPNGETLLDRTYALLASVSPAGCWLSGANEYGDYPLILDQRSGAGPMSGILSSLERLRPIAKYVVFVPVDMPGMNHDFLLPLLKETFASNSEGAQYRGFPLPLVVRASERSIAIAREVLESSKPSIKSFANRMGFASLEVSPGEMGLANVNTPEEWDLFWKGVPS